MPGMLRLSPHFLLPHIIHSFEPLSDRAVDVDNRAGPAPAIERAFVIEPPAGFGSLIQIGIFRLNWPAWELATGVRRIAPSASGLHWKRIVALNGLSCSG